jgi:hypothetical protein
VFVGSSASRDHERVSQMIECASQIMESVPQHESQLVGDDGDLPDVKTYLAGLDIVLSPSRWPTRLTSNVAKTAAQEMATSLLQLTKAEANCSVPGTRELEMNAPNWLD